MSKDDLKLMEKSDEQKLATSIGGTPLSEWSVGKPFMATSDRTLYVFDPASIPFGQNDSTLKGKTLTYAGRENILTPDLKEECVLLFTCDGNTYRYASGKTETEALKEIDSSKLPLMSDLELIDNWNEKLTGMTLWTKSNLWYDKTGARKSGLRFEKIKVAGIKPATGVFPMMVKIIDKTGDESYLIMNYTSDMADSRSFSDLFYLTDPQKRYPQISDENWELIKQGRIGLGMTKEECRLSLGNPDELDAGHNTSNTVDIWQYSNGTYLIFNDGLLTRYRQ